MDQIEKDILKWYNNDKYIRLGSDISVTELLKSPRQIHLCARHATSRDPATSLAAILPALSGNGVHDQLQKFLRIESTVSGKWLIERPLSITVNGMRLKGRFDALYNKSQLYDFKTMKMWKYLRGDFKDFEIQLNVYDYMLFQDGIDVKSLEVYAVLLDWRPGEMWKPGYPASPNIAIPILKWDRMKQIEYITDRINGVAKTLGTKDDQLPLCELEERWAGIKNLSCLEP